MLAVDPRRPATVYAGTARGLFKSTDAGRTWHASGLAKRFLTALAFDPKNPKIVYAGAAGIPLPRPGGVFKSVDGGQTWRTR